MSFETLSERLTALQESNAQLKELIERLATIKFQPGSIPLDDDDGNVMTELSSEIQQTLKDQDEDFELLQEEVYDLDSGRPGSELDQQKNFLDQAVKRAVKELKGSQIYFRKAQLTARRNLQAAQKEERELLLQSYLQPRETTLPPTTPVQTGQRWRAQQNKELSQDEKEVNASSDVTLALRRTHDMMAAELSRSQFAHQTLLESTAALAELSEQYSSLDTMLSKSRNLLGTLITSQKSDTWYLETAFYILSATIAWLVWRRLLYGPMWWLLWFPLKMFFKSWVGVFTALGLIGGASPEASIGSSLARGSIIHSSGVAPGVTMSDPTAASVTIEGLQNGAPTNTPQEDLDGSEDNISDQVGKIIDERESQNAYEGSSRANAETTHDDNKPNPKKRMWEEEKEAEAGARKKHDEL